MGKTQKRALLTDNGTELGVHLAYRLVEEGYVVDLLTDVSMYHEQINSYHINWYNLNHSHIVDWEKKCHLYRKNKDTYDLIYFNHNIGGGPTETEFLPYVETDFNRWTQGHYSNVQFTFQMINELHRYIDNDTKVVWGISGLYDFRWNEGAKFGTGVMYENSRISLAKSFALHMPGIYFALNVGDVSEETPIKAGEIIQAIHNTTREDNSTVIFRNGQTLLN